MQLEKIEEIDQLRIHYSECIQMKELGIPTVGYHLFISSTHLPHLYKAAYSSEETGLINTLTTHTNDKRSHESIENKDIERT